MCQWSQRENSPKRCLAQQAEHSACTQCAVLARQLGHKPGGLPGAAWGCLGLPGASWGCLGQAYVSSRPAVAGLTEGWSLKLSWQLWPKRLCWHFSLTAFSAETELNQSIMSLIQTETSFCAASRTSWEVPFGLSGAVDELGLASVSVFSVRPLSQLRSLIPQSQDRGPSLPSRAASLFFPLLPAFLPCCSLRPSLPPVSWVGESCC